MVGTSLSSIFERASSAVDTCDAKDRNCYPCDVLLGMTESVVVRIGIRAGSTCAGVGRWCLPQGWGAEAAEAGESS